MSRTHQNSPVCCTGSGETLQFRPLTTPSVRQACVVHRAFILRWVSWFLVQVTPHFSWGLNDHRPDRSWWLWRKQYLLGLAMNNTVRHGEQGREGRSFRSVALVLLLLSLDHTHTEVFWSQVTPSMSCEQEEQTLEVYQQPRIFQRQMGSSEYDAWAPCGLQFARFVHVKVCTSESISEKKRKRVTGTRKNPSLTRSEFVFFRDLSFHSGRTHWGERNQNEATTDCGGSKTGLMGAADVMSFLTTARCGWIFLSMSLHRTCKSYLLSEVLSGLWTGIQKMNNETTDNSNVGRITNLMWKLILLCSFNSKVR